MYIAGTAYNFEGRLHQLPVTEDDLNSFLGEAPDYTDILDFFSKYKINREYAKKHLILLGEGIIINIFEESSIASSVIVQFVGGADFAQSGPADYLQLFLPNGTSHVFWAHAGTSTQPSAIGSPTYHQIDVDGLDAAEVKDLFCQSIVNTGEWTIEGFSEQFAPVNTVAPTIDNEAPEIGTTLNADVGTWTSSPTSYSIQWKVNGSNSGSAGPTTTFDTTGLSVDDIVTFTVTATNSIGTSSPVSSSNSATVVAAVDWWLEGGATGVVAAYNPKTASDYASSLINIANPGSHDAIDSVTPSWSAGIGWTFDGASQYISTDITPTSSYTILVQFDTAVGVGVYNSGGDRFGISNAGSGNNVNFYNGLTLVTSPMSNGNICIAGVNCYKNGSVVGTTTGDEYTSTVITLYIGAINVSNALPLFFIGGSIKALAIYNNLLSDSTIATIATAMAAL